MSELKIDVEKIRAIQIGNVSGYGFVNEDGTVIMEFGSKNPHEYVKAANLGTLSTITLMGMQSVAVFPLTPDEKLALQGAVAKMNLVKTQAIARVENDFYDKAR